MAVFVLDKNKRPLMPCSEKRARKLLEAGRARIHRITPFVIPLVDRKIEDSVLQPLTIKIDPGSNPLAHGPVERTAVMMSRALPWV